MKGDPKVIEYLNRGLRSELTAVNQYWLHYRLLDDWGYKELAKKWRKESIEEMHHADKFIERIIFLEGFANLQVLDPLRIGQTIQEILEARPCGRIRCPQPLRRGRRLLRERRRLRCPRTCSRS